MILVIGPIPQPINGCSLANQVLLKGLRRNGIIFETINTSTENMSSKNVGDFSIRKILSFIHIYTSVWKVRNASVVYITPGQTFFGVLKYFPFIFFCLVMKTPYVLHIHGNHLGKEYNSLHGIRKKIFRYCIANAAVGIVLSDLLRNNFVGLLDPIKVKVVENFAQDEYILPDSSKKPQDKPRILYLSNLMAEKGILYLLDALILLDAKGIDYECYLAGKIEASIEDEVNEKLARLKKNVFYLGVISGNEKRKYLFESNIFVLPTSYRMEGQPISILEAMAAGNIILTTSFSGIPDIVDQHNGYFIEQKSSQSIFSSLVFLSENLRHNVAVFQHNNVDKIRKQFTEEVFETKIIKILDGVSKVKTI